MVNLHAALFHHFLELAVADRIRHVPAHAPQDHLPLKMAALELDHRCGPAESVAASYTKARGRRRQKFATEPPADKSDTRRT